MSDMVFPSIRLTKNVVCSFDVGCVSIAGNLKEREDDLGVSVNELVHQQREGILAWTSQQRTSAWINEGGNYRGSSTFRTSGENLRREISDIKAEEKALTLEEGPLAF